MSLRDLARLAMRHKYKGGLAFTAVVALGVSVLLLWPRTYASEAILYVRLGRASVGLDPTATVGQVISVNESREREINSSLQVLSSRELFDAVIDDVGEAPLLDAPPTTCRWINDRLDNLMALLRSEESGDPAAMRRETAYISLKGSIECDVPKLANVVRLRATARSPELAQAILRSYVAAYQQHHVRLHDSHGAFDFFAVEAEQAKKELEDATRALQGEKNKVGLTSIEGQRRIHEDQFLTLERDIGSLENDLATAQSKVEAMEAAEPELKSLTDKLEATSLSVLASDTMRAELFKLEIEERDLTTQFDAEHPRVKAVKEKVRQSRQLLATQQLLTEKTAVHAAQVKLEKTKKLLDDSHERLLHLNEQEVRIREFEQRLELARANYRKYADNLEQARIDAALTKEQISNIEVAQQPSLALKHVAPRRLVGAVLVLACALMASFGTIVASEYFDDRSSDPDEIEQVLQAPVILAVPRSRREARVAV